MLEQTWRAQVRVRREFRREAEYVFIGIDTKSAHLMRRVRRKRCAVSFIRQSFFAPR